MSKKTCFWCDNIVEKDGELCPSCRERKIKSDKELKQIDKEYKELFGHLDCIGMIKLYKERSKIISDLEVKLAEKEKQVADLEDYYSGYTEALVTETQELKQQLAEKEKELKKSRNEYWEVFDKLDEKSHRCEIATLENIMFEEKLKQANQDKISFCIEKLKEVKKLFEEKYSYDVEESDFAVVYEDDIDEIIDNQIKQLKEK